MKFHLKDREFSEHIRLSFLSIIVGLMAGLASIFFKIMIHFFQSLFWGDSSIISAVQSQPLYLTILIPAMGGLLISPLIYYGAKEAKGHGVPEIMESLIFRGGKIRNRVAVIKAMASSICIGSGGSTGREGPIVQISASIASSIGHLFRIKERAMRTLVAAGAGAGIGATFNAPIAGGLFAVEVLLGEFGVYSFSPIIIASVIATLVSRLIAGDFAAFTVPKYTLISVWEIGPYLLLGIISGLVAILFIQVLYFLEDKFETLRIHPLIKPALGGLMVGGIGLYLPQIFGVGYEGIDACLQNQLGFWMAFLLVFAKIFSTSMTLGSGGSGGIFAPSLFLGAMTGNLVGSVFHSAFPGSISSPGAFSLVGMGAVVAAATHAPITSIIIIFELTNDYKIILPLMLSCIIASFMTVGVHKESIYTMKLKRRGIMFREGREVNILKSLSVKDFISHDYQLFFLTDRVGKIIDQAIGSKHHSFQIVDQENNYIGCFSLNQLKNLLQEKDILDSFVIAQDLAVADIRLNDEDDLEQAMKIFGLTDVAEIAVLQNRKFAGVIKRKDVIEAYNHEIIKREAAAGLVQKMKFTPVLKSFDFGSGYKIMEMDAPPLFWNKSLIELNLKALHRIDVLLIKRKFPPQTISIPTANEVIRKGDRLILAGLEENITKILVNKK
ncbi:MAG: chloride channel protein [Candidatus Aminicenantes bacterium]|nr:chloride channel protein [Candidatus Aminicenantes bacterium]MDH5742272.1 chloride channel protein [Candidatus Aminicenantes bacterium]